MAGYNKEASKRFYNKHKEKKLAYQNAYYQQNREKYKENYLKRKEERLKEQQQINQSDIK